MVGHTGCRIDGMCPESWSGDILSVKKAKMSIPLHNADKKRVGEIKESGGLYQVYKPGNGEQANAANPNKMLTINKLHDV